MKLTLVGGGGSRTPVLYHGLVQRQEVLRVDELVLHDTDAAALGRIGRVLDGIDERGGPRVTHRATTDLDDALDGADFVLTAIRAGGFDARVLDETIPLEHGVIGQETVGPGGFALALRNVPALAAVAARMSARCPDAWLVNLSNPAGMATQALVPLLDGRVVGVCDSPLALGRGVAAVLGVDVSALHLEYAGLNHLGWLRGVWLGGRDVLPGLLESPEAKAIEEVRLFGADEVRAAGRIPNEYVYFYEHAAEAIANVREAGGPRGAFLLAEQRALAARLDAAASPAEALAVYEDSLRTRNDTYMSVEAGLQRDPSDDVFASAGGYHEMALSVVEAIACDSPAVLIVNTTNRGAVAGLADDDVVEVPAVVRGAGVFPLATRLDEPDRRLVEQVKAYERATLAAIEHRSVADARAALAAHPLVADRAVADAIVDGYLARIPGLADWFEEGPR